MSGNENQVAFPPMKQTRCLFLLLTFLFWASTGAAHLFSDFDQSTGITLTERNITVEYRIWFGPPLVPGLGLDLDGDRYLSEDELFAFLEKTGNRVQQNLFLTLDTAPLALKQISGTISTTGTYPGMAVDTAVWYAISVNHLEKPEWELRIRDENFPGYGTTQKLMYLNTDSTATDIQARTLADHRIFQYRFDGSGMRLKTGSAGQPRSESRPGPSDGSSRLLSFFHETSMGPGMLMLAFATAFLLGAGHALSPGHGKALVAAFLVGSRGTKTDAVKLGLIVTFTHVISVILLGLLLLFLSNRILPAQLYPWISVFSGLLIVVVGIYLLARQPHGHSHSHHHHAHDHNPHDHGSGQDADNGHDHPVRKHPIGLLSMGIAGGMVPCPSAIVVLLVSVTLQKIALGLAIILVFSLGLASVLVCLGLMVVSVSTVSLKWDRFAPVLPVLPRISAVVILGLGLVITFQALMAAGVVTVHLP